MITDINSEDRLVEQTFAAHLEKVLGVNIAVASVRRQEALKRLFPPQERVIEYRLPKPELLKVAEAVEKADLDPDQTALLVELASTLDAEQLRAADGKDL